MLRCCLGLAKLLLKSNLVAIEGCCAGKVVPDELLVVLPSFIESLAWFKYLLGSKTKDTSILLSLEKGPYTRVFLHM